MTTAREKSIRKAFKRNPVFRARGRTGLTPKVHTQEYSDARGKHVRYHSTDVVSLEPNGYVTLRTGGYMTVTTKRRMNQVSEQWGLGFSVGQRKGNWYIRLADGQEIPYDGGELQFDPKGARKMDEPGFKRNPTNSRQERIVHTICKHCGQDIEGSGRDWRDRGNNRTCPAPLRGYPGGAYKHAPDNSAPEMRRNPTKMKRNPLKNADKMCHLQEKRGAQWFTIAMFPVSKKQVAIKVGKQVHRRKPTAHLRLIGC